MKSRFAITKLKAILLIDLIIVAAAAGTYLYLQDQGLIVDAPKPAEFIVTELKIAPLEAEVFEPILVTVNVTNVGDEHGVYMANLTINNVIEENQTILVLERNFTIVEFTIIKEVEGIYKVEVDGLTSSFTLKASSLTSGNINLSKLVVNPYEGWVNPYEGWVNEPIAVRVNATNFGTKMESLSLRLMVDDSLVDIKRVELAAGATIIVEFTFNATTEGKHTVKVNNLRGEFKIVPTGYHTLMVNRSGGGSKPLTFTLNGITHNTPYTELLPLGEYTLSVPNPVDVGTGILEFSYWNDGVISTSRTFKLVKRLILVATYTVISGYASCPSLFTWNGTHYVYVTEVSNGGWLGYIDYINENGDIVFGGGTPWDYIKLDNTQLTPRNGYYDLILSQQWDEIFYIDAAYMIVVDHPANVEVYSTMSNYINQAFNGEIYTVSKDNLIVPVSAVNEKGENLLPHISQLDGVFTHGSNGLLSPSWNNITLNQLTINLGDLSSAQEIKLVINGMVDWGAPGPYYDWIDSFKEAFAQGLVPNGTQINPPSYMEVMDGNGNWVRIPKDRQIPIPSDYIPRSFAVDLTGLFPEGVSEYQIRMTNFWNVTFDYIGVDITPHESITVLRINPVATFQRMEFGETKSTASGSFTRYGDVTPLVLNADDMFVIGMQGDQVALQFPTASLTPLAEGMERDIFLFVASWFKDPPGNWGYGFEFTVDPLPFQNMSGFPYPPIESYPYDSEHLAYIMEYNTRIINVP